MFGNEEHNTITFGYFFTIRLIEFEVLGQSLKKTERKKTGVRKGSKSY